MVKRSNRSIYCSFFVVSVIVVVAWHGHNIRRPGDNDDMAFRRKKINVFSRKLNWNVEYPRL